MNAEYREALLGGSTLIVAHGNVLVTAFVRNGTPGLAAATLQDADLGRVELATVDDMLTVCAITPPLADWHILTTKQADRVSFSRRR